MLKTISDCRTDEEIFQLLCTRLEERVPGDLKADCDAFVARIRTLPPGLRAMAATHELDVSITLDDLGWHFANWHHRELAKETALGLRELEAEEAAVIFEQALQLVLPHWDHIGAL